MSEYKHKRHNVTVIMYHIVCPTKYRKIVFDKEKYDKTLSEICIEISKRYEIDFIEIGTESDHVHFLVQSVPSYSPSKITQIIKSIIAKEMFRIHPEIRKILWGGEFWSKGYFLNTVGQYSSEEAIKMYIKNQGKESSYKKLHKSEQLSLFENNNS